MSARSRSRPRAGSTPSCCAAASWSAKSDAARSFQAKRGAGSPCRSSRAARASISKSIIRILPTQSAMIAKSLEGLERPEVLDLALRHSSTIGTQAARTVTAEFLAREDWSPAADQFVFTANGRQCIAAALAAVVPSGGRCGVEALTYPFIKDIAARLGVTLVPLAMDEARRSSGRGAKGPPRSASVGAVHSADDPKSAGHDHAGLAPRRSAARRREARPHRDRGYSLRLSRRGNADGRARARPLHRARQPVEEGGARPRARLHRFAAAPARAHHGRGSLRRLDRRGICVRRRPTADGGRHRRRTVTAEADRCRAPPADGSETPCRLRDPGQPQILPSLADAAAALALADLRCRRGAPRHRADAVDDLCRGSRACPERRPAGARRTDHRATRFARCVRLREC